MVDQELERIRALLDAEGNHSHTSRKFQDDLLFYAKEFATCGNCLIEVGCFKGGLTAQLAYVARELGQRLEVIDIDSGYLEVARAAVKLAGKVPVNFNHCDFSTFAAEAGSQVQPTLILIDGDHRYDGVTADIRALYDMRSRPFSAAFHDFSLRYTTEELSSVRVDRALVDAFGQNFQHNKIGEIAGAGQSLRTIPGEDGHYHQAGYSEGVLVECRSLILQGVNV